MTIHIKDGGTWKEASLYVRDGGTWKSVNEGYIKDSGTWKQFFVNRVTANITISSDTANYTLNTAKVTGYVAGKTDVVLTINSGVTVYSASTGSYAFTVDTSWTTGDTVTIVNNGVIQGRGGNGGAGAFTGNPGSVGGPALNVQRAASINNANRIAGGGGGGGGGGGFAQATKSGTNYYGGAGGGGGLGISTGGAGGSYWGGGFPSGGNGTLTSAGGGGNASSINPFFGNGGSGGSYGSSGGSGTRGGAAESGNGGSGGAGGASVVGNSNITWIATGTRNGSIS